MSSICHLFICYKKSVLNFVGCVPLWVLWAQSHFAILCLCWYFVGPKYFLVVISCVKNFLQWIFHGSNIFSCGYFVCLKFFLYGSKLFLWVISEKTWHINISETAYSSPNQFQQLNSICIRKVFQPVNHPCYCTALVYTNCVFSHLFCQVI